MEYNYMKAPVEVAKRIGLDGIRKSAGEGFVVLSESDMRMVDLTTEEKALFFGCEMLTEQEAIQLISENETVNTNPVPEVHDTSANQTMEE